MRVAVLITLLNDRRVTRTLDSLFAQSRVPDEILVADGGSTDGTLEAVRSVASKDSRLRVEHHPGSVAETRSSALAKLDADVVAFLDADEVASPGWLAALVAPIEAGEADFTGGPTRPLAPARSAAEAYLNDFEAWFYPNVVAQDVAKTPMGNSAWRRVVFERIGGFDRRLVWGGEDYDVNVRAIAAGFRGRFVPGAWVYHDQSNVATLAKLLKRKYRYNKGAAVAYLKNGALRSRAGRAVRDTAAFRHRYEAFNWVIQPAALVAGWWTWRRLRHEAGGVAPQASPGTEGDR